MLQLPEPLQKALETEARIRTLATENSTTFDEWRVTAVPTPTGPRQSEPGDQNLPAGRWSYDPEGFYIRFAPASFLETRIEISVPRAIRFERVGSRITTIADAYRRLVISYDNAGHPSSVTYQNSELDLGITTPPHVWTIAGGAPIVSNAGDTKVDSKTMAGQFAAARRKALDVANLRSELRATPTNSSRDAAWIGDADAFLAQAWQSAVATALGIRTPGADPPFDPSSLVAVPGASLSQRLGQSGRPSPDSGAACDARDTSGTGLGSDVAAAMSQNGDRTDLTSVTLRNEGGIISISQRLDGHMCSLPSGTCLDQMIASGGVAPGTLKGAEYTLAGAVQQINGRTRVTLRIVDVETGVIVATGLGDADGTDGAAVTRATDAAMKQLKSRGTGFCGGS
jgi:hypothetical protein